MWTKLCCAFLLYTLAGCAGTPVLPPIADGSYTLTPSKTVDIGGGATVRYEAFSDSRCPANAQCIWAGKVSYSFVLNSPAGAENFALEYEGQQVTAKALPAVRFGISFAAVSQVPLAQRAVVLEVRNAR